MPGSVVSSKEKSVAIVTGCDRRYLKFLEDLLLCLSDLDIYASADVHVFDIDFEASDKKRLSRYPIEIMTIDFEPLEIDCPDPDRRHIVSSIRPVIRDLFPGYEYYVYLDTDVWLQNSRAIQDLVTAAASGELVVIAQQHPTYSKHNAQWVEDLHTKTFGAAVASELNSVPVYNGGVFALHAESTAWDILRDSYVSAVKSGGPWFGAGQAALAYLSANNLIPIHDMPALYNWMAHLAIPAWDIDRKRFVTPDQEKAEILIMHQTADTKWQSARVNCTNGKIKKMRLSYGAYRKRNRGMRRFLDGFARKMPKSG